MARKRNRPTQRKRPRKISMVAHAFVARRLPRPPIEIDRGLAWYVLWTPPQLEGKVERRLSERGLAAYVPIETVSAVNAKGKQFEKSRPAISRYVFVGLNAARPQWLDVEDALQDGNGGVYLWLRSREDQPLGRVLRDADGKALRIPACLLQRFADSLTGVCDPPATRQPFEVGGRVRASEGAFQAFVGEVQSVKDQSVRVLVDLFGRLTSVEFDAAQLEAA